MSQLTEFRSAKDHFMAGDHDSPLTPEQRRDFSGLSYYHDNTDLRLELEVEGGGSREIIEMQTSTGEVASYLVWGKRSSRVPGSGVRGRGSGERETTASSLAGKQQAREEEDNGGQGKDGPAGAIAQGGNGR